ncbi:hypothetical protein RFI_35621 [Reticulomyxa filosa]|uniref:Uncharacterized protein n=1 Tax=Reticulomyxa filosa TaxID=46433 RepID=X6LIP1_RETFI|nr:hypothetical protein RFI_35621 [Reticulomyxa filosa]|eukprot:ETO01818.1 hypothetical protein RFI_35621 [Reticulomyxa filosa]
MQRVPKKIIMMLIKDEIVVVDLQLLQRQRLFLKVARNMVLNSPHLDSIGSNENNKKKASNEKKNDREKNQNDWTKIITKEEISKIDFKQSIGQFENFGSAKIGLLFCNSEQERFAVFLSNKIFFKEAHQRTIPSIAWDNQNETNAHFEQSKKFLLGNFLNKKMQLKNIKGRRLKVYIQSKEKEKKKL